MDIPNLLYHINSYIYPIFKETFLSFTDNRKTERHVSLRFNYGI